MEERVFMRGYKAFDKGMVCHGKQYAENTVFGEDEVVIHETGLHFCVNPMDCMTCHSITHDSVFAEVEALAECVCEEDAKDSKHCTTKLRIGKRLSLEEFINACVEYNRSNNDGDHSNLASSGCFSKLASAGYHSILASSGYFSNISSSGDDSRLASSGNDSILASSGDQSKLASSGYCANLVSSGEYSNLVSSGNCSVLASTGDYSRLASNGNCSKVSSTGDNSVIINAGDQGYVKGVIGTWITLAEYNDNGECTCIKSAKIDGDILKENTWYTLIDGEFTDAGDWVDEA